MSGRLPDGRAPGPEPAKPPLDGDAILDQREADLDDDEYWWLS